MYRHSGIGRYLRNLVPLVLPHLHADRIRVLGAKELFQHAEWLNDPRIELFETDARIYSAKEQLLAFQGACAETDLIWVPHYNAPLFARKMMVATIHDIAPLVVPQILDSSLKRAYAKLLIQRTVSQAAALLCVSEFTKQELERRLGVPSSKMTVTPLALDRSWPDTAKAHVERDSVPYLLFVGNIKPNKNLQLLLDAFATVRDQISYRLLIAGRTDGFGTGDDTAKCLAARLGDRVRFTGEVSDGELQSLYAGARALVVPSVYEGFGLTLLEAMQLGCPVLSSSAGSLREVGGDAALFFDPYSMEELSKRLLQTRQDNVMDRLRTLGFARVQRFSFERCAEKSAGVMNRLLETAEAKRYADKSK